MARSASRARTSRPRSDATRSRVPPAATAPASEPRRRRRGGPPDGFPTADIDVGLFDDPKVRRLARRVGDPVRTLAALSVYISVVLESWRRGERATATDASPAWVPDADLDGIVNALADVGLLDAEGFLPEAAFEGWFRPAQRRREERREAGRRGGFRTAAGRRRDGFAVAG